MIPSDSANLQDKRFEGLTLRSALSTMIHVSFVIALPPMFFQVLFSLSR